MAYEEELADRLRLLLAQHRLTEKKMFGGLAFLLNGHMAVAVSGQVSPSAFGQRNELSVRWTRD